jgi:hypothetical protein
MAINQAVCATFKQQLLDGDHDISSDTVNLALYTASATLDANTSAYSVTNEVGDSGTYAAGGGTLQNANSATISAQAALIYNTSSANTNAAIAVLDFGGVKTSTNGTFTIQFPANDASNAILRIS